MTTDNVAHPASDCKWKNIPDELKALPQWAMAGKDKRPLSAQNGNLFYTSVDRPSEWLSFRQAITTALQNNLGIGYILNESDPFTCIDLDVKENTTQDKLDLFWRITKAFDSYTELSRGGKGLHIWLKGKIGPGFRRDGIEIYSQTRFIICTGNVVINRPIADKQEMLSNMVTQMRPIPKEFTFEELEQEEDDWYILKRACEADNGEKFWSLWTGDWQDKYPSQSEADHALIEFLSFYTKSNKQCRRMFRDSALGQREKAMKNDVHINRSLRVFRAEQREDDLILQAVAILKAKMGTI